MQGSCTEQGAIVLIEPAVKLKLAFAFVATRCDTVANDQRELAALKRASACSKRSRISLARLRRSAETSTLGSPESARKTRSANERS